MHRPAHALLPLLLLLPVVLYPLAEGHGLMCQPRQRGAYISQKCGSNLDKPPNPVIDYCAHCLNAGTVATVTAHLPPSGWKIYDPVKEFDAATDRFGMCGDAKSHNAHMIGGDFMPYATVPIVEHYKTGGHVDFVAEIDTNHNGYFDYFLCDLDACGATDISARCFRQGHCYKLQRVPHPDCENPSSNTHYECGPIDDRYPGRWYLPCRNTGHVGVHIVGGPSGTMRYKLPDGVSCKHCVIQWYWATANSCAPRGLLNYMARHDSPFGTSCSSDGGGRGTYRSGMHECGGDKVPEEFWSCADVQITENGNSAGPVTAVFARTSPPPQTSDEDRAEDDPEGTFDRASDEMRDDIEQKGQRKTWKQKYWDRRETSGTCLKEFESCDASTECCGFDTVCVYTQKAVGFSCRFWWSLWEEKEDRERKWEVHRSM